MHSKSKPKENLNKNNLQTNYKTQNHEATFSKQQTSTNSDVQSKPRQTSNIKIPLQVETGDQGYYGGEFLFIKGLLKGNMDKAINSNSQKVDRGLRKKRRIIGPNYELGGVCERIRKFTPIGR